MNQAVFLDRDGVLNPNIFNPATEEWESPHRVEDFELFPWTLDCLKKLQAQYLLFLVSNQPSYAKGKTSLENIQNIHAKMKTLLDANGLGFSEYFYCYHHPEGIVPEYSGPCECRKPSPHFLNLARERYQLDVGGSWMVGDRITDIQCGQAAGVKTIYIQEGEKPDGPWDRPPGFYAVDLVEAVRIITGNK